jgi:hypothetical protein
MEGSATLGGRGWFKSRSFIAAMGDGPVKGSLPESIS